ncbi:MAG: flavin reductase family protein [Planctomycetes bacterium]|nr:flavin reductase family protein [Planctomycetota bacterium]MCH9725115.1 flavin reductase family protein [Planctomycetota bacterium]MCH9774923.1 flavin reductase family protein [Planctomycetota bacterium]MCH9789326.1 flavin reductase family protein [Planctomycetota bacterium]
MPHETDAALIQLDVSSPIWNQFFTVAPLVVIGSREPDGADDLAPKHMVTPMGWDNLFGFVCAESHGTYQNIKREGEFTVSFPNPDQVVLTSLSATPRCEDNTKPAINALPTFPATMVKGALLKDSYLFLECKLDRIIDDFGKNSLITGSIVAAQIIPSAIRANDRDDQDILQEAPLLAYVSPGRYTTIDRSFSFPFPLGFRRGDE